MEKKLIGFYDEEKEEFNLEDFKDKWILIVSRHASDLSGKIIFLDNKNIGLLPYLKVDYKKKGIGYYKIETEGLPHLMYRQDIVRCRETSEESTQEFCNYSNRKSRLEYLKGMKEIYEHEQFFDRINNKIIHP